MHSDPPFTATETAHLYGGPNDGEAWLIPLNTHEMQIPQDAAETQIAHYHYCPLLSTYFRRPTYRSADLLPLTLPE